jgi:hypothetical protein
MVNRILILLMFLLFLIPWEGTLAQGRSGITVTPSIIRLDLESDAPQAEIYYKNNTRAALELKFSAQDFSETEETGRIRFLDEKEAENYQYSLASWIIFERQSISLLPGEEQAVKVSIDKDRLTPGGHYASIQAEIVQPEEEGQVPIKGILSTLIFVRTSTGNERENMSLETHQMQKNFLGFPQGLSIRLKNSGNVELVPYGLIEIRDMFGNVVAKGILNEGSLIILPQSIRRFDIQITRIYPLLFPGIYNTQLSIKYGKEEKKIENSATFLSQGTLNVVPLALIILVMVILSRRKPKDLTSRSS